MTTKGGARRCRKLRVGGEETAVRLPPWCTPGHGTGVVAPSVQKKPRTHALHADSPRAFWKEPAAQSVHRARPLVEATVPTPHGSGCAAPPKQKWPRVHGSHDEAFS